ncbi:MAG: Ig-like domain-containing protein [Gemmatimonadota bacterium]
MAALVPALACSSSGSGPDEERGLLRVSASDVDRAGAAALAGFEENDVSSFRIQLNAGAHVVVDTTFFGSPAVPHDFTLEPNTYVVLVEAFQSGDVLLFTGADQATVVADDTASVGVDLDPSIGAIQVTIADDTSAVVATNATAPVRVQVRNGRGQPVSGVGVALTVDPASAGSVVFPATAETGADGSLTGTFQPARREGEGRLRLALDGLPLDLAAPATFSVESPVDVGRSTISVANGERVLADGVTEALIEVRIVDADGRPQAGIPVTVVSSRNPTGAGDPVDFIDSDAEFTDAAGRVRATLSTRSSSSLAGDATVTALADGKELSASGRVSFRSLVSTSGTRISTVPVTVRANGSDFSEIVVEVRGTNGLPLADTFVELRTNGILGARLTPGSGRTDRQGLFRSRIVSTTKGSTFVDVIADGLRTSASGFVIFN